MTGARTACATLPVQQTMPSSRRRALRFNPLRCAAADAVTLICAPTCVNVQVHFRKGGGGSRLTEATQQTKKPPIFLFSLLLFRKTVSLFAAENTFLWLARAVQHAHANRRVTQSKRAHASYYFLLLLFSTLAPLTARSRLPLRCSRGVFAFGGETECEIRGIHTSRRVSCFRCDRRRDDDVIWDPPPSLRRANRLVQSRCLISRPLRYRGHSHLWATSRLDLF